VIKTDAARKNHSMKKKHLITALLLTIILLVPGCGSKAANCKQPDVFCVGLVTEVGRRNDRAYNQAAWEGIQQAKAGGVTNWVASIETVDARDFAANIGVFAEAGYDVIVTVGDAMSDATRAAAKSYPDTYFIGLNQDQSTNQDFSPNLTGLVFAEDQIGYLAGALAALMSKTGQIGAVCGSDALLAMKRYGEGFLAGAAYVNPEVKATVTYHNDVALDKSLLDPEWGATTANALVDSDTDIIFGVGGSTGNNAIVAAVTRGIYGIGADTDLYYAFPVAAPHLYASVMELIAPGVSELIKQARDAQTGSGVFPSGNYLGQVGLSPYHDLVSSIPDEVKLRMTELNQALLSGTLQTGVSLTNP
jgi:basic membrane protein A and related proteins